MDSLEQDQTDFHARIDVDSFFAEITALLQRKGVTESDIETALSVLNEKVGKIGACVIVLKPVLVASTPDAPGPEYFVEITVQAITQPMFNDDATTGTLKTTEAIAQRLRVVGHRFKGYSFAAQQTEEVAEGKDSYSVSFRRLTRDDDARCGKPLFEPDSGAGSQEITLTTATAGASIYYTTDGSYPSADNPEAGLYAAPITPGVGNRLRAVAYKTGLIASDITEVLYT